MWPPFFQRFLQCKQVQLAFVILYKGSLNSNKKLNVVHIPYFIVFSSLDFNLQWIWSSWSTVRNTFWNSPVSDITHCRRVWSTVSPLLCMDVYSMGLFHLSTLYFTVHSDWFSNWLLGIFLDMLAMFSTSTRAIMVFDMSGKSLHEQSIWTNISCEIYVHTLV